MNLQLRDITYPGTVFVLQENEHPSQLGLSTLRDEGVETTRYFVDVPVTEKDRKTSRREPEGYQFSKDEHHLEIQIDVAADGRMALVGFGLEAESLDRELFHRYRHELGDAVRDKLQASDQDYDLDAAIDEAVGMMKSEGYHDDEPGEYVDQNEGGVHEDNSPLIAPGPDGQHFALVEVPDDLAREFPIDTLKELGVTFDNNDSVAVLKVKIDADEISLDRQFEPMSYADRFETAVFNHYRNDLEQEVARKADAEKTRIANSVSVEETLTFREPDSIQRHLTVNVDDRTFDVVASFDGDGRVTDVAVDPKHHDDPHHVELTELLESAKDVVIRHAQQCHDTDEQFLQAIGWQNSRTLVAGYCVIPGEEVDRMGSEAAVSDSNAGLFRTAEGYPIRLDFDQNANIEHATIPGTLVALNPVLEGSRNHFVEAKAQLADHGIVLSKADSGDYRVDYHSSSSSHRQGEFGSVRFADTIIGAVETGKQMAAERDRQAQSDNSGPERQAA